jgi:pimeloyl-ACP methyl ester carboxylesterase
VNDLPTPGRGPAGGTTGTLEGQISDHLAQVPGGSIYYRIQGTGPALVLIGGGPSNADTRGSLASHLAGDYTVITYDRRGYSRSHLDDPAWEAGVPG